MNIGIIHQRTGGKCGVALEMDKVSRAFRELGHNVYYCTGEGPGYLIPELHLLDKDEERLDKFAFGGESCSENELRSLLDRRVSFIKGKILGFLDKYSIDLLVVQNIFSVVSHLGTGVALCQIASERGLPMWGHSHDFHWEFHTPLKPAFPFVTELLRKYFPPVMPNVRHLVINSVARNEMKKRLGADATLLVNVIDSHLVRKECPRADELAFRKAIGVGENDLLVMCGTRIIPHKYIEAAIALTAELTARREQLAGVKLAGGSTFGHDSRVVFVECGKTESFSGWYLDALRGLAGRLNVETRWIGDRLSGMTKMDGEDLGGLFDAYCHADIVTYTTVHEGWGNQLLEGIAARKPMVVFEYPIFLTDIKQYGFDLVSIGSRVPTRREGQLMAVEDDKIQAAADSCVAILRDPARRERMVSENLSILERELSFEQMKDIFTRLLNDSVTPAAR